MQLNCTYKGCKLLFTTLEQLEAHCSIEHKCPHLGCETQCKNATALKEHIRDKHNIKCDVICQGEFFRTIFIFSTLFQCVAGQRHQLSRDGTSALFKCPICPHATKTTKAIQKHCKDHISEPMVRRTTNRFHPYNVVNNGRTSPVEEAPVDIIMSEVVNVKESEHPGMLNTSVF